MKRILLFAALGWTAVFFTVVLYVDFDQQMSPLLQISDYLMTFHVAGYLLAHGQASILYPPADATTFAGMPFDHAAHLILPKMPASSVAEFMYMPLAAAAFVPLSFAPLHWSLLIWQVISGLSLFLSVQFLWLSRTVGSGKSESGSWPWLTRLLSCLLLLPVCLTIWIGQVGLVFGMLPLASGCLALARGRHIMAGLIWSLAILKPQFLVPAAVLTFALFIGRRFQTALGLAFGLCFILGVSVAIFTPALNLEWIHCLKISDIVYSDPNSGIATHIATSLPRTLILMTPRSGLELVKPLAYALSALLFATALFAAWRVQRSKVLDDSGALRISFLLGLFVTPLVMPHFFLYDYCLFALVAPVVFLFDWPAVLEWPLKKLTIAAWGVINVYSIIVLAAHQYAMPWLFMALMCGLYFYLFKISLRVGRVS